MTNFGIFNSTGLLIDGFDSEQEANGYADLWMAGEDVFIGDVEEVEKAEAEQAEEEVE